MSIRNRGVITSKDFHMTREVSSSIPALLLEGGFMDSTIDHPVITSADGQQKYAKAVANVVVEYLDL